MAIQDHNPERRNLVIISLAFVIYFVAGGRFDDEVIRLQVVNVRFANPDALVTAAWLALGWLAFRYWITHRGLLTEGFNGEIMHLHNDVVLTCYVNSTSEEQVVLDPEEGVHIALLKLQPARSKLRPKRIAVSLQRAAKVGRDHTGKITSHRDSSGTKPSAVFLEGVVGRVVSTWLFLRCSVAYPTFSAYMVPWVLFFSAVALGVYHQLWAGPAE